MTERYGERLKGSSNTLPIQLLFLAESGYTLGLWVYPKCLTYKAGDCGILSPTWPDLTLFTVRIKLWICTSCFGSLCSKAWYPRVSMMTHELPLIMFYNSKGGTSQTSHWCRDQDLYYKDSRTALAETVPA